MIISLDEIKTMVDLSGWSDGRIEKKLRAIEQAIRSYTNNNFQNRNVRGSLPMVNGVVYGCVPGLRTGDTVQISSSCFHNGLYIVEEISDRIRLYPTSGEDVREDVLITKIEYPDDVVDCAINLMSWEVANRGKIGIKSETLSRHSVTYYDQDASNQVNGYPVSLLGCLAPYRKARC